MPDMVRQALFNILGDAVPGRPFFDLFAGTGAVGLEALSRGASHVEFVERDRSIATQIADNLQALGIAEQAAVRRADVYRWSNHWVAPAEPVTLFLGPPFPEFEHREEALMAVLNILQTKLAPDSVVILQSENKFDFRHLPDAVNWDHRRYGRNQISFWIKPPPRSDEGSKTTT
jgi:16S rRNA (guanine(966)-N(2))-methyltransferase RsmD